MLHRILLVDDDFDEQLLLERSLRRILPEGSRVMVVSSGHEAIRYLIGEGVFSDRERFPFPTLLVTDLNMPDGDGLCLLDFIQQNPGWSVVPRVVFTCSEKEDDVRTAFLLGASAFHLKPLSPQSSEACLRRIIEYWTTSLVPPVDQNGRVLSTLPGTRGKRFPPPQGGSAMQRREQT